jgi:methionyl-tRNA formyltransferase
MARILLIGLGASSASAFDSLRQRFDLVGVVRKPDAGDPESDPVVRRARQSNVALFTDTSRRSIQRIVSDLIPDCVVVSSYNRLFDRQLITRCPFVNVHYAPLPRYRGMATVNWAILNDEPFTAITIHTITEGADEGRILYQQLIPVRDADTVGDLYERLNDLQRSHLGEAVEKFLNGDAGVTQNENEATYGCNRMPQDGQIDWSQTTRQVSALVRALGVPFPGAFTFLRGQRLFVWRASPVVNPPRYVGRVPGRVVAVSKADGSVDVLTGDGVLRLRDVQLENGEAMAPSMLITSVRTTLGLSTSELLGRLAALEQQVAELQRTLTELSKHASV